MLEGAIELIDSGRYVGQYKKEGSAAPYFAYIVDKELVHSYPS
jgi:hypothetical protein